MNKSLHFYLNTILWIGSAALPIAILTDVNLLNALLFTLGAAGLLSSGRFILKGLE